MRTGPLGAPAPRRYEISAPYAGLGTEKYCCALPLPVDESVGPSPYCRAVFGSNSAAVDVSVFAVICSIGTTSTAHRLRPWVAAISSWSRGWILRSYTATDARLGAN